MQVQETHLDGTTYLILSIIVIVASAIAACENISSSGTEGVSHLNLYLTDAPAEYQEVNVDVQEVWVRYLDDANPDQTEAPDTETEEDSVWVNLRVEPFRINLLDLTGADTLIATADDLEPGYYNGLRLVLGDDNDVVIGGKTHKLDTPSAQESGYKIEFGTRLESGGVRDLTLDFDAEQSVVMAGQSGKYLLIPVLKAFEGRIDNTDG